MYMGKTFNNRPMTKDQESAMRRILEFYAEFLELAKIPFGLEARRLAESPTMLTDSPVVAPKPNLRISVDGRESSYLADDYVGVRIEVVRMIAARDFDGLFGFDCEEATGESEGRIYHLDSYGIVERLPEIAAKVLKGASGQKGK